MVGKKAYLNHTGRAMAHMENQATKLPAGSGLAAVRAGIDDAGHAAAGSGEKDPLEELHKIRDEVLHEWSAQSWANYKQVIGAFKGLHKVM